MGRYIGEILKSNHSKYMRKLICFMIGKSMDRSNSAFDGNCWNEIYLLVYVMQ